MYILINHLENFVNQQLIGGNESKTMDFKHSPKDPTSCTNT